MPYSNKILAFEFVLNELMEWYNDLTGNEAKNDFSILKSLKLLFFVSAARTNSFSHSVLLEDVFTNYVAMPYGHVESDVYAYLRESKGELRFFKIDNERCYRIRNIQQNSFDELDSTQKSEIKSSISFLKKQNRTLVLMSPFDLVNLSHAWYSWQSSYKNAGQFSPKSFSISTDSIKSEDKIFSL